MADIFDQDELQAAAATESTEVEIEQQQGVERADEAAETAEQAAERARDERGRFAPKEGEDKDRKVDHGAFHKEREQRKHWESEAKKAQEQLAAIAALRQRVSQQPTQEAPQVAPTGSQAAPEQQAPDPLAALRQELDGVKSTLQQRQQTEERHQIDQYEAQTLGNALTQAEAEFKTRQPDYNDATNHLIQARAQELQYYGYSVPQIQQTLAQEALEMTRMAIEQGRSPAELAYQVAQARGYRPQQQQAGGVATIDAIIAGQKAGKSVGGAAGAGTSGVGDVNAATLANMSEAEFDRLYQTPEGRRLIDSLS